MHDVEGVKEGVDTVRADMESRDVEGIDENMVDRWEEKLEQIEGWYWDGVVGDHEGDEVDDRR